MLPGRATSGRYESGARGRPAEGIDDPARPSGGNSYDLQVCRGLTAIGWTVRLHAVPGSWPDFDAAAHAALAEVVRRIPDGAVVLLDGLVASTALVTRRCRRRTGCLVALVHMPLGHACEGAVLGAVASVVTSSAWTRRLLQQMYALPDDRVHIARPGVDAADLAPGTADAGALLCVAAVTPAKGHDVLLDALGTIDGLVLALPLRGKPRPRPGLRGGARATRSRWRRSRRPRVLRGDADRLRRLTQSYGAADLLVLASRAEERTAWSSRRRSPGASR